MGGAPSAGSGDGAAGVTFHHTSDSEDHDSRAPESQETARRAVISPGTQLSHHCPHSTRLSVCPSSCLTHGHMPPPPRWVSNGRGESDRVFAPASTQLCSRSLTQQSQHKQDGMMLKRDSSHHSCSVENHKCLNIFAPNQNPTPKQSGAQIPTQAR